MVGLPYFPRSSAAAPQILELLFVLEGADNFHEILLELKKDREGYLNDSAILAGRVGFFVSDSKIREPWRKTAPEFSRGLSRISHFLKNGTHASL